MHSITSLIDDKNKRPVFIYDGGCPFCKYFAELSELRSGIPSLIIIDGRANSEIRGNLLSRGFNLKDGAILMIGDDIFYGSNAVHWLCSRMDPSDRLLALISKIFSVRSRSYNLYPFLLFARKVALSFKGLDVDPDLDTTND